MIQEVEQAVKDAFGADAQIEPHLKASDGRVYGTIRVEGSKEFDELDDVAASGTCGKILSDYLDPNQRWSDRLCWNRVIVELALKKLQLDHIKVRKSDIPYVPR